MPEETQPTPEEQFAEVVERHNHLVRKNQALVERLAKVEEENADYQARAVATVETLNETIKQLQAAHPGDTSEVVPSEDVEVVA